mgnify:CR=1 FL=1
MFLWLFELFLYLLENHVSAELEQGKKRNLGGNNCRESGHISGQILARYLAGLSGEDETIFVLVTALNPVRNPAKSWPDSDLALVLCAFRWRV